MKSEAAAAAADLLLFGVPRLVRDSAAVHVGTRKALLLLAMLALDGAMARDALAARLWPDLDNVAARRNLRRELHRLRELGVPPAEDHDATLSVPRTLRTDVHAFHTALAAGDDDAALRRASPRVLDGFDGIAGADVDDWLRRWRERLLRERAAARTRLAARLRAQGDALGALAWHRQALFEDPCNELAAREVMQLHAGVDDRAAAAQVYRRLSTALHDELDASPSPATAEVARRLGIADASTPARRTLQRPARASDAARLPLIGRDDERARILSAWQSGRTVYLSGLPGSGKTRLAAECASTQGSWLRLACRPFDASVPFGVARRMLHTLRDADPAVELPRWVRRELAGLAPEWGDTAPPPEEAHAQRLQQAFAEAWRLLLHDNFSAVIVDDWHWCDADSATLLDPLFESSRPASARIFRTARLDPRGLLRMRHEVGSARAVHIVLEGLAPAETASLVAAVGGAAPHGHPELFVAELHDATEGNPFYVIETLRALRQARTPPGATALVLPATVRDAVLERVGAAGEPTRRLLEAASLLPEPFEPALLNGVMPIAADEAVALFENAEAALLIERDGGGYRFAHDLIRDSLQANLSPARRALLHERLAQRLEASGAPPALVAAQWEGAGRGTAALPWRLRAADESRRMHALADAEQHYRRALADGAVARDAMAVHLGLAELHQRGGRRDAAQHAFDDALAAARQADAEAVIVARLAQIDDWLQTDRLDDAVVQLDALAPLIDAASPLLRARAIELRAIAVANLGDLPAARTLLDAAISALEGQADALAQRHRVLYEATRLAYMSADGDRTRSLARVALACAESLGDDAALAKSLLLQGLADVNLHADRAGGRESFERARLLAHRGAHVPIERRALKNLVNLAMDAGRAAEAGVLLDEWRALAPWFEHERAEQDYAQMRYVLLCLRGDLVAARAEADGVLAALPRLANRMFRVATREHIADLYLHTGDLAAAAAVLEDPDAQTAGGDFLHAELEAKRAWLDLLRGDAERALRRLHALPPAGSADAAALVAWVGAAAALAGGDVDAAERWLAPADIGSDGAAKTLAMLLVQRLRVAAMRGRADAAAQARAAALLAAGCVPAIEAGLLRQVLSGTQGCASGPGPPDARAGRGPTPGELSTPSRDGCP